MKRSILSTVIAFSLLHTFCLGDVYFHNPRGSNNRLNEKSANRNNANRVFDSQNNNRGGYNVGDQKDKASNNENEQYHMAFFQSSKKGKTYFTFEWTNQHGAGGARVADPTKLNSNFVLQFMCQPDVTQRKKETIRNGRNTQTQQFTKPKSNENAQLYNNRKNNNVNADKVLQESWELYDSCYKRNRNKGLFTADQKLAGESSIYTRQNPTGTRRGYECPEERDYYPYWHPTEWKDIAVLTSDTSRCDYYKEESFNVKPKGECGGQLKHSVYNNKKECEDNKGAWTIFTNFLEKATNYNTEQKCKSAGSQYTWGIPYGSDKQECLVKLPAPDCRQAPWTRVNHLGNGRDGVPVNYTWTLPYFPSEEDKRCVFRLRYNISTDDYDPWNTNSSYNNLLIEQNPTVNIGVLSSPLKLAINTAQYGRTFQDRSHLIKLRNRKTYKVPENNDIFNLNVRGKRGNIVQVYPAVEYDFIPNRMTVKKDSDFVHMQWTGSNTHNNGNPGGDGQTGDAGEGTAGTDRTNIVESSDSVENYPLPYEASNMFKSASVVWTSHTLKKPKAEDIAASMASAGYYSCLKNGVCTGESVEKKKAIDVLLNNAPASYAGMLLKFTKKGCYHYICSRNNNFSNRSQKGTLCIA